MTDHPFDDIEAAHSFAGLAILALSAYRALVESGANDTEIRTILTAMFGSLIGTPKREEE